MPAITQKLGFDASGAVRGLSNLTGRLNEANASLSNLNRTAGKYSDSSLVQYGVKSARSMDTLGKSVDKTKKKAEGLIFTWQTITRVLGVQLVVRSLNLFTQQLSEGITKAKEFGLAIEEIQTISGRGQTSEALAADILAVSDALGVGAQDLAEGYYQTLSNQVVEAGEALQFTAEAAKLATVTASDTKDAINALSSVMNSYGLEASEAGRISGTLFKTVELGRLRLSEIANVIGRVTPLTSALGVSWEETAASIAVMTRQGVRADTAITQLRAVMTKMIKPTEALREIFRKWGVEDGKQAIDTFGGLRGVLEKLAEETGGSSSEMAELLKNVRAIVGQMSIMTNDGIELEETLSKITEGTKDLNEQWEQFIQSDAKRLANEMVRFENSMTRAGSQIMPMLNTAMEAFNKGTRNAILGWKVLTGGMDSAAYQAEIVSRLSTQWQEEADRLNEWHAERQKKRFDGLTQAQAAMYTAARKEEFKLQDVRDAAIKRANDAIADQADAVVKLYSDSVKRLGDFVDKINDRIKTNTERIADIDKEIWERNLDQRLDKAQSVYQKMQLLEGELNDARQNAARAFGTVGASEESQERALEANQKVLDLLEKAKSLAEQAGDTRSANRLESAYQGTLENRKQILELANKELEKAKPIAKELYDQMAEDEARMKNLIEERNKLYQSGELGTASADARLEAINKELKDILERTAKSDAFLNALGIDSGFGELTKQMTDAMNAAHKDWEAEVARMKAAFDAAAPALKVALDPTGEREQAARAIGFPERAEGQGITEYSSARDEAIVASLQQQVALEKAIADERTNINNKVLSTQALMNRVVEREETELKRIQTLASHSRREGETRAQAIARATKEYQEQYNLQQSLLRDIQAAMEATREGTRLSEEQTVDLRERIQAAHTFGQLTKVQAEDLRQILATLQTTSVEYDKIDAIDAQLLAPGEVEKLRAAESAMRGVQRAQEGGADVGAETGKNIEQLRRTTEEFRGSVETQKQAVDGLTNSVGGAVSATSNIGPTASSQTAGVNTLVAAYKRLETQARLAAAATAAAGSGGGAVAYHGGPMSRFFAAGGRLTRGQDKILTSLSAGETVVNSKNSRKFFSELNSMNQGSEPVFREQGGSVTNVGDVNVTVNGGDSSQQTVREIGHALRREIQRGNIKLR